MLYPQNGYRIVTIDSMTSLQPMYSANRERAESAEGASVSERPRS